MKTILYIGILLFGWQNLSAQVIPINHNMRNLKVGNVFIYQTIIRNFKPPSLITQYSLKRIVKYDTLNNKQYAVFQDGYRERADSTGVYGIAFNYYTRQPFAEEYLRYPFFVEDRREIILPNCPGGLTLSIFCCPMKDTICLPIKASVIKDDRGPILGLNLQNYRATGESFGDADYSHLFGTWQTSRSSGNEDRFTTLCGAVIEGQYYGDSTCLVASSTSLRGEEFTSFSASLAPNPTTDISTIRFILPTAQGLTVEVRDMLGREVVSPLVFDALSSGMNAIPIDVSSLPRGVYALRLRSTLGLRATTMMIRE